MASRKKLTAAARRAQLIQVGREVFAENGYEATSVEEIASRAKVSKPIVYEHFGGKEGLYAVVVDREMEYVIRVISEALSAGSPRERAEQSALAFLTWVKDGSGGFSSLLNEVAERVSDVFAEAVKQAGLDPDVAPIYAHALIGMVTLVGQWWSVVRKPSVEKVASHIVALAWMGLRNLPEKPDPIGARKKH
ncbi:MAG: TetR/AcrR family transcriptional regulator [Deltaproteobacteria bacterium]|nr:TetR/AcrR family transcriptional regulator [Deltaproteobacteria bacterium]